MGWIDAKELGIEHNMEFGWVASEGVECPELAFTYIDYKKQRVFQHAGTVGDREGLSVEYFEGVTHFMPLQEPQLPGVK